MSLRVMSWVLDESEAKLGARLVLLALAEYAHDDGDKAFPAVETIARKARLSERGTRDALRKLEADGMIVQTGKSPKGTLVYRVVGPFNTRRQILPPGSLEHAEGQNAAEIVSQTAPDPKTDPRTDPSSSSQLRRAQIEQAWLASTDMIQHRSTYFADDKIRRLIDKVVKKYGVDDVVAAITSYSKVLVSKEHYFNHRWTFADFLNRGLDRFVPEARPEETFRGGNGVRGGKDNVGDGFAAYD